jgi:glycosyltransferase involved in cell wall biosynthesis
MPCINVYFRNPPPQNQWIYGDKYIIPFLRRLIRGRKIGGIEKVFLNLCKGFDLLNVHYTINKPFENIKADEPVIVLGIGNYALKGYKQANPIIAGIGLMTHPADWPNLFQQYPVATYLQHTKWTNNIYIPYYGADKCTLWPAGIDTEKWQPTKSVKKYDILVYNKIMWDKASTQECLTTPILKKLEESGLTYHVITYGQYKETQYHQLLEQSRAMLFLCEHESQGFACCEALSMNVPVLAYDQGFWLDPNRFFWGESNPVPATSVPFFDARCGEKFSDLASFYTVFDAFFEKVQKGEFSPRSYILENLTLKKSAQRMLDIVSKIYCHA